MLSHTNSLYKHRLMRCEKPAVKKYDKFGFRIGELPRLGDMGHYQPEAICRKFAARHFLTESRLLKKV